MHTMQIKRHRTMMKSLPQHPMVDDFMTGNYGRSMNNDKCMRQKDASRMYQNLLLTRNLLIYATALSKVISPHPLGIKNKTMTQPLQDRNYTLRKSL